MRNSLATQAIGPGMTLKLAPCSMALKAWCAKSSADIKKGIGNLFFEVKGVLM